MIVFRDSAITVIRKPSGMASEPAGNQSNVISAVKEATGQTCLLVHRLDRETEGLMVLANSNKAASALSGAITAGLLKKEYLAIAEGIPDENSGEWRDYLFRDAAKNRSYVVKRTRKGVREAILCYQILQTAQWNGKPLSLLRVHLRTGRTHQIRVQFASRKHPLLGDKRYGSGFRDLPLALLAEKLEFPHPESGENLLFEIQPDYAALPWSLFCLREERGESDENAD